MSTKNIARTAIEGGRNSGYKTNIRILNRRDRHQAKALSKKMLLDEDLAFEQPFTKFRYWEWDDIHKDTLSFMEGWFHSKIGMSWDDVYSGMKKSFDFRTIPGLHIVGHLLDYIHHPKDKWPTKYEITGYYVDDENIVRYRPEIIRKRYARIPSFEKCLLWASNRKIRDLKGVLWWYGSRKIEYSWALCEHTETPWWGGYFRNSCCPYQRKSVFVGQISSVHCFQPIKLERLSKLRKLTPKEQKFWKSMTTKRQDSFVFHSYEVGNRFKLL